MFLIPMLALAVTPQPTHQTVDRPFHAQPSSIDGFTALRATSDWHASLRGARTVLMNDVFLDAETSVILELERRDVVGEQAELMTNNLGTLDRPDVVMLGGAVAGDPGSLAYLAFSEEMTMGFIQTDGEQYVISSGPYGQDMPTVVYNLGDISADTISLRDIACQVLEVPGASPSDTHQPTNARRGVVPCRVVDVAIETDTEFRTSLFGGNASAAADYATILTGAVSEIYERDLNVKLNISFLRIWTNTDPWTENGGTVDQLFQFEDYWNANMGSVDRDNAHFFSGRGLGGGVAYLGAICKSYSYALSANLNGFFPYPLQNESTQNWDMMVTAHEWGHNFGAPHTHEQAPLANIDNCGNGTCDNIPGTIMSYCHTCGNGTGDINLNFHPQNIGSYMLAFLDDSGQWTGGGAPCDLTGDPLCNPGDCLADTNNDGLVTPADFNAWVLAFNAGAPECDQNGDGACSPADFNAWVLNYNAGCP